jgi:AraC family transcriptional regulator
MSILADMSFAPAMPEDDPLERARRRIEVSPSEALTLEELAATAGLSAYHFVRLFNARFGASPMAYLRARRMALAAEQLAGPRPPALIELAFDSGFETQEGFTRAFKRAFGVSPGRFRRSGSAIPQQEVLIMTQSIQLGMESKPQRRAAFRVAGVSGLFDEDNKGGIPALWPPLVQRLPLKGQAGHETFGVMWGDSDGGFHYMAAAPIAADAPAPEGLEVKDVPAQDYLVFRQTLDGSELHPQMQAAVKQIWGERIPGSGYELARGPDLEVYPADFQPDRAGATVEWWIPVKA